MKQEVIISGRSASQSTVTWGAGAEADLVTLKSGLRTGATIPAAVGGGQAGLRLAAATTGKHWKLDLITLDYTPA